MSLLGGRVSVSLTEGHYSERGVKKAPELLPEYYTGRDEDQGSIGL